MLWRICYCRIGGIVAPPYEGGARNEQGDVKLREPTIDVNGMCINTLSSSHPPTPLTGGKWATHASSSPPSSPSHTPSLS